MSHLKVILDLAETLPTSEEAQRAVDTLIQRARGKKLVGGATEEGVYQMHVLEYLRTHSLEDLTKEFGIKVNRHPRYPLAILNYHLIDSPKLNPIVRECRGLVIDFEALVPVARAFPRFFNNGEVPEEDKTFDWESCTATSKEDGSLILLFNYRGEWLVNTRGSWADQEAEETGKTWRVLFLETIREEGILGLPKDLTHVFEYCSPGTQIVKIYPKPISYLLAAFETATGREMGRHYLEEVKEYLQCPLVESFDLSSPESCLAFIEQRSQQEATWEGLVVCDKNGLRLKIKNSKYVLLHHLHGNGNIYKSKWLFPLVLSGERDEVLVHFPKALPKIQVIEDYLMVMKVEVQVLWYKYRGCETQKDFALGVKDHPLSPLLFQSRKSGELQDFSQHGDLLLKRFLERYPEKEEE